MPGVPERADECRVSLAGVEAESNIIDWAPPSRRVRWPEDQMTLGNSLARGYRSCMNPASSHAATMSRRDCRGLRCQVGQAASAGWGVIVVSYSVGVNRPSRCWRRRWW